MNVRRAVRRGALSLAVLAAVAVAASLSARTPGTGYTIVGWNNLGMHCLDADFGVFAILPPYNTVQAHVIDANGLLVRSGGSVAVTYEADQDLAGSINTTSAGKTNFWQHALALFGAPLAVDVGLTGVRMPGASNAPQPMTFFAAQNWFKGEGIPITPYDDAHVKNPYPVMRLTARDGGGSLLATTRVVLPVSDEMDCTACHASGSGPAAQPSAGWVNDPNPQRDYRLNILRFHDEDQVATDPARYAAALSAAGYPAQGLYYSVVTNGVPILCAACHESVALGTPGVANVAPLTSSMHTRHAGVQDPTNGLTLEASANRSACYRCHPGSTTRCLRGAMGAAVAADGTLAMQCQACHGSMLVVGAPARTGWLEEPACQQCHTGTATHNNGTIRYTSVFDGGLPRVAVDQTFATSPDTPAAGLSLYRFSSGHGGLQCAACHGSTHAELPSTHANDNIQALDVQGHVGTLGECTACHPSVATSLGGPHGMHPVGQQWTTAHADYAELNGTAACQACHGPDWNGTVLSRSFAARSLTTAFGSKSMWRGYQIGCYLCHDGPGSEVASPDHAPVATSRSAWARSGVALPISLTATDADGDALTLRVVSQPAHGTAGLSGTTATYVSFPGFGGTDSFTFAAWDGHMDSNLATVTVSVQLSGDANGDGHVTVNDVLYLINHLFAGGPAPLVPSDVNGDGQVNVGDILYLINHLFAGGPAPV